MPSLAACSLITTSSYAAKRSPLPSNPIQSPMGKTRQLGKPFHEDQGRMNMIMRTRMQARNGDQAADQTARSSNEKGAMGGAQLMQRAADAAGVSLGPIGLTVGSDLKGNTSSDASDSSDLESNNQPIESIATLSTKEWREKFEKDGRVDLWVEEEFNAASRLVGGRAVHFGGHAGHLSGEGKGKSDAPTHKVKISNPACSQDLEVEVPEDRYILWEAEDQGLVLPYACRMGCCTACAVKVKSGELYQPQSLGVSKELRERGYGLMCVGFPLTDLELELCPDDLVYDEQFGKFFESQATNPDATSVSRDDFAIELALGDE